MLPVTALSVASTARRSRFEVGEVGHSISEDDHRLASHSCLTEEAMKILRRPVLANRFTSVGDGLVE